MVIFLEYHVKPKVVLIYLDFDRGLKHLRGQETKKERKRGGNFEREESSRNKFILVHS